MSEWLTEQGIFLLRVIVAGVCGLAIGIERQSRMKTAGVRTHFMVAVASSVMMLISKYGFMDVLSIDGISVDASRVAAGIITGIGILGGGLIFTGKQGLVSGMTTAAGIWVTVGVGMAVGCGMYLLGIAVTVLTLAAQFVFHRNLRICREPLRGQIVFSVANSPEAIENVIRQLETLDMEVVRIKTEIKDRKTCLVRCSVALKPESRRKEFATQIAGLGQIVSYEI